MTWPLAALTLFAVVALVAVKLFRAQIDRASVPLIVAIVSGALGFAWGWHVRGSRGATTCGEANARWPGAGPRGLELPDLRKFPRVNAKQPAKAILPDGVTIEAGRIIRVKDASETVYVPGGIFRMGTDAGEAHLPDGVLRLREVWGLTYGHIEDQVPQHDVAFSIGSGEVEVFVLQRRQAPGPPASTPP